MTSTASGLYRPCIEPPYFSPGEDEWDMETGRPGIGAFANAVQLWSLMQNNETTLQQASAVFNVPIEMVRQAVEWHPWMLLDGGDGDVIGHDGE